VAEVSGHIIRLILGGFTVTVEVGGINADVAIDEVFMAVEPDYITVSVDAGSTSAIDRAA
jgi:hypothetical protein